MSKRKRKKDREWNVQIYGAAHPVPVAGFGKGSLTAPTGDIFPIAGGILYKMQKFIFGMGVREDKKFRIIVVGKEEDFDIIRTELEKEMTENS